MFLILALIVVSASAYVYDMSRHNRSVVVHRLFQNSTPKNPICPRSPLSVNRYNSVTRDNSLARGNLTRLPDGYRMANSTSRPVPNKTVPAKPAPAPAPPPRSLRRAA